MRKSAYNFPFKGTGRSPLVPDRAGAERVRLPVPGQADAERVGLPRSGSGGRGPVRLPVSGRAGLACGAAAIRKRVSEFWLRRGLGCRRWARAGLRCRGGTGLPRAGREEGQVRADAGSFRAALQGSAPLPRGLAPPGPGSHVTGRARGGGAETGVDRLSGAVLCSSRKRISLEFSNGSSSRSARACAPTCRRSAHP
jgi:hypothetical protein